MHLPRPPPGEPFASLGLLSQPLAYPDPGHARTASPFPLPVKWPFVERRAGPVDRALVNRGLANST